MISDYGQTQDDRVSSALAPIAMPAPNILLVIVSYNSAAMLARCLKHVEQQTLPPTTIVIVDNASTEPATLTLLEQLEVGAVVRLSKNIGYGGAINEAVRLTPEADFIACLNPDAFPAANWLECLVAKSRNAHTTGSWASLMLLDRDPNVIDGAGDALSILGYAWRLGHNRTTDKVMLKERPVFSACAGACLYRASAFRQVGGFDETFFMYGEDCDLGFRLQAAGFACLFVPSARVRHIGSGTTGYRSDFSVFYGHRNAWLLLVKNLPPIMWLLIGPLHCMACLAISVRLWRRGQLMVFLRAKWAGLIKTRRLENAEHCEAPKISIFTLAKILSWRLWP